MRENVRCHGIFFKCYTVSSCLEERGRISFSAFGINGHWLPLPVEGALQVVSSPQTNRIWGEGGTLMSQPWLQVALVWCSNRLNSLD